MSGDRVVYIDDSDPLIQYTGDGWFKDSGSLDGSGSNGPTFLHTMHGTKKNDSFSFSFKGPLLFQFLI